MDRGWTVGSGPRIVLRSRVGRREDRNSPFTRRLVLTSSILDDSVPVTEPGGERGPDSSSSSLGSPVASTEFPQLPFKRGPHTRSGSLSEYCLVHTSPFLSFNVLPPLTVHSGVDSLVSRVVKVSQYNRSTRRTVPRFPSQR